MYGSRGRTLSKLAANSVFGRLQGLILLSQLLRRLRILVAAV